MNAFCMADTETSKAPDTNINHICAWSFAININGHVFALYGRRPSEFIEFCEKLKAATAADHIVIYFHNLNYDYFFMRKFLFSSWGTPSRFFAVKPHAPIQIGFKNGIIFRDSLILSQTSLEKWADNLQVTKKAVGKWDYTRIRNQDTPLSADELEYIACDVISGVECLKKLADMDHYDITTIPLTATGFVRREMQKRGRKNRARQKYESMSADFVTYNKERKVFHGGYTHANRFIINDIIPGGETYDFASSYPFQMIVNTYPCGKFMTYPNCTISHILENSEKYAFIFKLILTNVKIKPNRPMPVIQVSKLEKVQNEIKDNGRIISADYLEVYLNEIDLELVNDIYTFDKSACVDVQVTHKAYLPRWFTDYIYELFVEKTKLKKSDPVLYQRAKARINSLYGMLVMDNIKQLIKEEYTSGEYYIDYGDEKQIYNKYINNKNTITPYMWGVWVTAYAQRELFRLSECIAEGGTWLYSDTDSIFATAWDKEKIEKYNNCQVERMTARGYAPVVFEGKSYSLGVAELDKSFSEFVTCGAKRYCYRDRKDNKIHITVAGVPKKGAEALGDDIYKFHPGLIFPGKLTGKLTHEYITNEILIDENGNEVADSINLYECDYLLSSTEKFDTIEDLFTLEQATEMYI